MKLPQPATNPRLVKMASVPAAEQEQRDRIMSHMNRSHTRELTHYLRHYCSLSRRETRGASLRDITLQAMRIRAQGTDYVVHFHPPLASWSDVRPRVVDMDATARKALGISDIYVTKYAMPCGPLELAFFVGVCSYFACLASLPFITPGSGAWSLLQSQWPGGAAGFRWVIKAMALPVVGIHLVEPFILHRSRLSKHGVDAGTPVWWMWVTGCFLEGFTTFSRFDRVVAEKRAQKESKKH